MKNVYILVSVLVFSCVFGRTSNKHTTTVSPYGLSFNSQKGELSVGVDTSDDSSVKWKRRHKKRKKTRRPQRGR